MESTATCTVRPATSSGQVIEGHAFGLEYRRAHIDAHLPVGLEARDDDPGERFDAYLLLLCQSLVVHETNEAARAVAALLDFSAVCVPDAVTEINVFSRGFLHQ